MTVRIHAVCSPSQRDALDAALAALGEGWDQGDNWTPHSAAATPANPTPPPERYLLSAQLPPDQAARPVAILDAGGATWGKGVALAVEDEDAVELKPGDDAAAVPVDKRRESLARVLATHAAKDPEIKAEEKPR